MFTDVNRQQVGVSDPHCRVLGTLQFLQEGVVLIQELLYVEEDTVELATFEEAFLDDRRVDLHDDPSVPAEGHLRVQYLDDAGLPGGSSLVARPGRNNRRTSESILFPIFLCIIPVTADDFEW